MTGLSWLSVPVLFVLVTPLWASIMVSKNFSDVIQQQQQQQHPRIHNSLTNQDDGIPIYKIIDSYPDSTTGEGPDKAIDNNLNSNWNPNDGPRYYNNWNIIFELSGRYTVKSTSLYNSGDSTHDITNFQLEGSDDLVTWRMGGTVSGVTTGTDQQQRFDGFNVTGKFLKFTVTQTLSGYQPYLREVSFNSNPVCPDGFEMYGDYCLHYDDGRFTQTSAVEYCTILGGTLTYPINDDMDAWKTAVYDVSGYNTGASYPWAGATQQADGDWTWVDGTQVPEAMWVPTQPDGDGSCTFVVWRSDNGPLRDYRCEWEMTVLCQATLEDTTTTELPETTTPTVPSETTIRAETPTTTAGTSMCYSCIGCKDVDSADTNIVAKHPEESCFTAIYDASNLVIRGVAPEIHSDGECLIEEGVAECYCNSNLCNAEHVPEKLTQTA